MDKPVDKYTADEFFYDESFEDYDVRKNKYYEHKSKELLAKLGSLINSIITERKISVKDYAQIIGLPSKEVHKILNGTSKILDLKIISKIEASLGVKLLSLGDDTIKS